MKSLATVKLFVRCDNESLLLQRSSTDSLRPGEYDLPGGAIEDDEDVYAAAGRELYEETGILLGRQAMMLVFAKTVANPETASNITRSFVLARIASREVALSEEHQAAVWVPETAMQTTMTYLPHLEAHWHIRQYDLWQAYDEAHLTSH